MSFEVNDLQATVDRLTADGYGLVGRIEHLAHGLRARAGGIIVSLAERIG